MISIGDVRVEALAMAFRIPMENLGRYSKRAEGALAALLAAYRLQEQRAQAAEARVLELTESLSQAEQLLTLVGEKDQDPYHDIMRWLSEARVLLAQAAPPEGAEG